jgi:hypothetical protein
MHVPVKVFTALAFYRQICNADITITARIQNLFYFDFQGTESEILDVKFINPYNFADFADPGMFTL